MEKKKFFLIFLSLVLVFRFWSFLPSFEKLFARDYDYEAFKKAYGGSQFVQKDNPGWIPDETVYQFAAGFYLQGGNPILVNSEQPPLGKYILAVSIFLFQNTTIAVYSFFFLTLVALFFLSKYVLKNPSLALVTVLAFSFEKIFLNQLRYAPLLDIFQLAFILFAFYFFIKWIEEKKTKNLVLASLSLGAVAAIKFFITGFVIFISWVAFLTLKKRWLDILKLSFSVALATYLSLTLSYLRVLLEEPNPLKVLGIQKWIFWYHQSKLTSIFTIWPLIYFNRWQTWWGDFTVIQDPQWWLVWPVLFTLSFIVLLLYAMRKKWKDEKLEIILIWFLVYSLFISLAQASTRYLIPILPFLYIICIRGLTLIWNEVIKQKI